MSTTSGSARPRRADAAALLAGIGGTPLVELPLAELAAPDAPRPAPGARLFAKLESVNPGGSLKDRPVARMLTRALADGRLAGGRRVLDSTSGNAGIAYAMLGAALGVPVTLVVPGNASAERLARIRAHGAELLLTDPLEGYDFAIAEARRLAAGQSGRYWHADQYGNEDNWRAHEEGTGGEILAQVHAATGRAPDALVLGIGTGGSLTGIGRRLRAANPALRVRAVVPDAFPGIEGLKPLGAPGDIVPAILDTALAGERVATSIERAIACCRRLARLGFFVGPSSGAYVDAAVRLACEPESARATVVTLLCDTGERYLSTNLWGADAGEGRRVGGTSRSR